MSRKQNFKTCFCTNGVCYSKWEILAKFFLGSSFPVITLSPPSQSHLYLRILPPPILFGPHSPHYPLPSSPSSSSPHLLSPLDSITVSVFVIILVEFDKYRIWDEQACLLSPTLPKIFSLHASKIPSSPRPAHPRTKLWGKMTHFGLQPITLHPFHPVSSQIFFSIPFLPSWGMNLPRVLFCTSTLGCSFQCFPIVNPPVKARTINCLISISFSAQQVRAGFYKWECWRPEQPSQIVF